MKKRHTANVLIFCSFILLITGCAVQQEQQQIQLYKKGATQDDLEVAYAKCQTMRGMKPQTQQKEVISPYNGGVAGGLDNLGKGMRALGESMQSVEEDKAWMLNCMRAQGFKTHK